MCDMSGYDYSLDSKPAKKLTPEEVVDARQPKDRRGEKTNPPQLSVPSDDATQSTL